MKGVYGHEDCVNDIAEIKFDRPIAIKVYDNKLFSTVHQDEAMLKIFGHKIYLQSHVHFHRHFLADFFVEFKHFCFVLSKASTHGLVF